MTEINITMKGHKMETNSIDDIVRMAKNRPEIDTEKRIIIRTLAQYNDDDYYEIYETSYTDDGNLVLEIVKSNSHYGKRVQGWREEEEEKERETGEMWDEVVRLGYIIHGVTK